MLQSIAILNFEQTLRSLSQYYNHFNYLGSKRPEEVGGGGWFSEKRIRERELLQGARIYFKNLANLQRWLFVVCI